MDENGQIYTWGHAMNGALGVGQNNRKDNGTIPIKISKYNKEFNEIIAIDIAAGYYHSMVLTQNKQLYTFGYNGGYNSCIADINPLNNNNNNNNIMINRAPKKFFKPHLVDLKQYFKNNHKLNQQYGRDIDNEPPEVLKIFGGFYSSILMLKD